MAANSSKVIVSTCRSMLISVTLFSMAGDLQAQRVIYVDETAGGTNTGQSWDDAFNSVQDALDAASEGDEIWVSQGTYRPDDGESVSEGDRMATFHLRSGVRLFGGFSGTEVRRMDRRVDEFKAVLSGDLADDDSLSFTRRDDNSLHVVSGFGVDSTALLDGFFIRGGHALGRGVGIFTDVADSVGAGILLGGASPSLFNLTIMDNRSHAGGGVFSDGGSPVFANVVVAGNRARRGGAMFLDGSNPWIGNSTIVNNYADVGGGLYNRSGDPIVSNSIISGNGLPGDPESDFECERLAYPCTYGEVSFETRLRSRALADSAYEFSTSAEMITWLKSKPDIESVGGNEGVVRFRITGDRPTWIMLEGAVTFSLPKNESNLTMRPVNSLPLAEVAGRDRNSDGKVSNRDGRHALILDPFNWEWGSSSDGQVLDQQLARTPGYERLSTGQVDWYRDAQVTTETFKGWDDYDLVHVSTHGDGYCEDEDPESIVCYTFLSTGIELNDVGVYPEGVFAPQTVVVPRRVANGIQLPEQYFLGLGEEWFLQAYAQGVLDKTLIFLNACKTINPAGSGGSPAGTPDFLAPMVGASTTASILAWTNPVPTVGASTLAAEIYTDLLQNGRTIGNIMDDLRRDGRDVLPRSDGSTTQLKLIGNRKLRVREVVFLLSESEDTGLLEDGGSLVPFIDGVANDGQNDHLTLSARIDGVEEGELGMFTVQFYLDDSTIGGQFPASQADLTRPIDGFPNSHVIEHRVPAGRDIGTGQAYDLEIVASLPDEDAESRYEASVTADPCYWHLNLGGSRAGQYAGSRAGFVRLSNSSIQIDFIPEKDEEVFGAMSIYLNQPLPPPTTGSFMLGGGGSDGFSTIFFSVTEFPVLYSTGDGSEIKDSEGNVIFVQPTASTLGISLNETETIQGSLRGTFFATTDPVAPAYEYAAVDVTFRARLSLNPDGSPIFGYCGD